MDQGRRRRAVHRLDRLARPSPDEPSLNQAWLGPDPQPGFICVIVGIGRTKWFFDGGECRELRGTVAGDAKEYEKCPVLIEAVSDGKNATTERAP